MGTTARYYATADRPVLEMWLLDDDGTLIDFTGYTFSFRVGNAGSAAVLTKNSGIAGAVGSGTEPTGVPNVTVTWTAAELAITPGTYAWNLTCTTGGLDRVFGGQIVILDTID